MDYFKGGGLFFLQEIAFLPQKKGNLYFKQSSWKDYGAHRPKKRVAFPFHIRAVVFAFTQQYYDGNINANYHISRAWSLVRC